jgi:Tfp pilus assembly protein PilN
MAWVVLSAVGAAMLLCLLVTLSVRRETAELASRRAELEARLAPYQAQEQLVNRLAAAREAAERKRTLVERVRGRQAAAARLLSAMGAGLDPRVERVTLTPEGGEIGGRADSPLAANEIGERLSAQGLFGSYDLKSFERGAFTLAFTLEAESQKAAP